VKTVARDRNGLFRTLSVLLDDEGRYNSLGQKVAQYISVSEGQIIQRPTTTVGQVESGTSQSALHILNCQHYPLKFQWVYASHEKKTFFFLHWNLSAQETI
jgi:hypothetical protein